MVVATRSLPDLVAQQRRREQNLVLVLQRGHGRQALRGRAPRADACAGQPGRWGGQERRRALLATQTFASLGSGFAREYTLVYGDSGHAKL